MKNKTSNAPLNQALQSTRVEFMQRQCGWDLLHFSVSLHLPTDSSCISASDRDCDTKWDCSGLWSIPAPTSSSCRMDTSTWRSCSRPTRSPPRASALWSRFRMALENKFWRLFGFTAHCGNVFSTSSSGLSCWRNFHLRKSFPAACLVT